MRIAVGALIAVLAPNSGIGNATPPDAPPLPVCVQQGAACTGRMPRYSREELWRCHASPLTPPPPHAAGDNFNAEQRCITAVKAAKPCRCSPTP